MLPTHSVPRSTVFTRFLDLVPGACVTLALLALACSAPSKHASSEGGHAARSGGGADGSGAQGGDGAATARSGSSGAEAGGWSGADSPPEPEPPSPYAGTWVGKTSKNRDIGFTVTDDGFVDSLVVEWSLSFGASSCTGPASAAPGRYPIRDGAFEIEVTFPGSSVSSTIKGLFSDDAQSASGDYPGYSGGFAVTCGSSAIFGSGSPLSSATWEAKRGTYVCRYADNGRCDEPEGTNACVQGSDPADCGGAGSAGSGGTGGSGASGGFGNGPSGEGGAGDTGGGPSVLHPLGDACSASGQCQSGFCTDGVCCEVLTCGTCQTCNGYDEGTCEMDEDAAECSCKNGSCALRPGYACVSDEDCVTGFCADGVCCTSRCDGECENCANDEGECDVVSSMPDPGTCDAERTCDALGVCKLLPPGATAPIRPWNGEATGSVFAVQARRPTFVFSAAERASRYELQVDDSCSVPGFSACDFPSPEVSLADLAEPVYAPAEDLPVRSTVPVGTRYFWRVRACNAEACSPWSAVRYVDVGRQQKDLNGDGYADVVVGASRDDTAAPEAGAAYVFYGPTLTTSAILYGTEENQAFGEDVAFVGDVNGDGFADLAVGDDTCIPEDPPDQFPCLVATRGFLFLGRAGSVARPPAFTFDGGFRVEALGDVNADGYVDLSGEAGTVVLGGADSSAFVVRDSVGSDYFDNVAGGDVNGDGYSDLLVREEGWCGEDARLDVYFGGATEDRTADISIAFDEDCGGAPDPTDLAVGDVNGDGHADVIVGEGDAGLAAIYTGGPGGQLLSRAAPGRELSATYFDDGLAVGDLDADGIADVVLVEPSKAYFGGPTLASLSSTSLSRTEELVGFLGDVDGDGFGDVALSDPDAGKLYVLKGSETLDAVTDVTLTVPVHNGWTFD